MSRSDNHLLKVVVMVKTKASVVGEAEGGSAQRKKPSSDHAHTHEIWKTVSVALFLFSSK
jgi:hypothetical protein